MTVTMTPAINVADERRALMQTLMGGFVARAVSAAAQFDLAGRLRERAKTSGELAREAGLHADSVYRLMRALAAVGIFEEHGRDMWTTTPLGEGLRDDAPGSLRALARFLGASPHLRAWSAMGYSVRCGDSAYEHANGETLWQTLSHDQEFADAFDRAMTGIGVQWHAAIVEDFDFSGIATLVDVGAGHGSLLAALLHKYDGMRGVLFDLPHVVEGARANIEALGLADRCSIIGGDFFEAVPAGGDAYIMANVIHDWSDEKAAAILASCRRGMPPGARMFVAEHVLRAGNDFDPAKLLDLEMLVMTEGGRERTEREFRSLFERAGLQFDGALRMPAGLSIVAGSVPR